MKKSELTLRQLECLLAVEEKLHFRQAAELLGLSQPALTAQIQNLEAVLSARLVERSRAGVALTPIGREVATRARAVSDGAQAIIDFTRAANGGLVGTIRLGTSPTLGPYLLPHVVAALHRRYKELRLYVRENPPRDLEFELGKGDHDVVLAQLPIGGADHIAEPLFREPLYLAVASDHPIAKAERVTVDILNELEVLSLGPQYNLYEQVNALCRNFGATLLRDYEGTSLDALRQMAGMGMGAAFLPALYVHSEIKARSDVVARPIIGRSITRTIGLVWRRSAGRADHFQKIAETIRTVASKRFPDLAILNETSQR